MAPRPAESLPVPLDRVSGSALTNSTCWSPGGFASREVLCDGSSSRLPGSSDIAYQVDGVVDVDSLNKKIMLEYTLEVRLVV